MIKMTVNLYELLKCISNALDLVSPRLANHHHQVAYVSYRLAKEMKLPAEEQKDIFLAALVHDIGALSVNERLEVIEEEEPLSVNNHAFIGAKLLENFKPLRNAARLIRYHHMPWDYGNGLTYKGEKIPLGSHVIHLADRICAMIRHDTDILSQLPQIMNSVKHMSNSVFEPDMSDLVCELAGKEYIWFDLVLGDPVNKADTKLFDMIDLEIDDIIDLSFLFSQIIDFRSSFTARHSAGVAVIAEYLAELEGFSQTECKMMRVAGYFHDLGKLAIDNAILEKPAKLTEEEFNLIRRHTYYTYGLLSSIPQFETINIWASYHHERLDGKGYPFHKKGEELPIGSRIMAVADVFTAITEPRPYRMGMNPAQAAEVLNGMVKSGALDQRVVRTLMNHYPMVNELREKSQQEAAGRYSSFLQK